MQTGSATFLLRDTCSCCEVRVLKTSVAILGVKVCRLGLSRLGAQLKLKNTEWQLYLGLDRNRIPDLKQLHVTCRRNQFIGNRPVNSRGFVGRFPALTTFSQ